MRIRNQTYAAFIGGTTSGKSTITDLIARLIQELATVTAKHPRNLVTVFEHDMLYYDLAQVIGIQGEHRVWDDPNLLNHSYLPVILEKLAKEEAVLLPYYQKNPGILVWEKDKIVTLLSAPIVLVEGFTVHAVKDATAKYLEDGEAITHIDSEKKLFFKGQEVIPEEKRQEIHNKLFGEQGYFGNNTYFVHCEESEALFRRILRDYMIHDRTPEEIISMWPGVMETFDRLIKPAQNEWITIDNTAINGDTAKTIYETARQLMEQAEISVKPEYDKNNGRATVLIERLGNSYLDGCVDKYFKDGPTKLRRFVNEYPLFRQKYQGQPIYDVLPEDISHWLSVRI